MLRMDLIEVFRERWPKVVVAVLEKQLCSESILLLVVPLSLSHLLLQTSRPRFASGRLQKVRWCMRCRNLGWGWWGDIYVYIPWSNTHISKTIRSEDPIIPCSPWPPASERPDLLSIFLYRVFWIQLPKPKNVRYEPHLEDTLGIQKSDLYWEIRGRLNI